MHRAALEDEGSYVAIWCWEQSLHRAAFRYVGDLQAMEYTCKKIYCEFELSTLNNARVRLMNAVV